MWRWDGGSVDGGSVDGGECASLTPLSIQDEKLMTCYTNPKFILVLWWIVFALNIIEKLPEA